MQCLRAQQLISDALERTEVDAAELEEAKRHCRACAECGRFVTAQLALKRALLAEPSSDLADRVMAGVRAEAEAAAASSAAAPAEDVSDTDVAAAVLTSQFEAASASTRLGRSGWSGSRRSWLAAAAGVFVVVGLGALLTANVISRTISGQRTASTVAEDAPAASEPMGGYSGNMDAATEAAPPAATSVSGPAFITVNGMAYALRGDSAVERSTLTIVGSASSSLDSGSGAPMSLTVLASQGSGDIVFVENGDRLLEFERITRDHEGRSYVLRSGTISGFGVWPSLPSDIAQPTSADGSPSLESLETSSGISVFVKSGSDASSGIAFPPGAAGPTAVSGAPVWTWWTPL